MNTPLGTRPSALMIECFRSSIIGGPVVADESAACYRDCMSEEPTDLPDTTPPPMGTTYACPNCGQGVFVSPPPIQGIVQCPYCKAQFFCGLSIEEEIVD